MAVYTKSGNEADSVYAIDGSNSPSAYDVNGEVVYMQYDPPSDDPYIEGRTLLFEDNFNFFNKANWGYELGDVRNNELQTYRAENNVSISDSCLVITAKKEDFGNKHWTSGSITGQHKKEFTYGRFEAKIKFPNMTGAFGAFWLLGASMDITYHEIGDNDVSGEIWPKCGEIDITETIPGTSREAQANLWKYSGGSFGAGRSGGYIVTSAWHVYACEWTDTYIAALLDGVEFKRWTFSDYDASEAQAYHLPFYMILNLAVGASGGTPSESTTEMKMYVDWVRVYAPLNQ